MSTIQDASKSNGPRVSTAGAAAHRTSPVSPRPKNGGSRVSISDTGSPESGTSEGNDDPQSYNGDGGSQQLVVQKPEPHQAVDIVFASKSSANDASNGIANDAIDEPHSSSQNLRSWFKKSCKEVAALQSSRKLANGNNALANGGISYSIGPDKVPAVFASNDLLWNGTPQVISYFFLDGNNLQHQKVVEVIQEWTWYANIVFHQAQTAQDSNVRIRFDPNDGSWSYVGRQCDKIEAKDATMNLAWLDKFSPLNSNERAVILHEFGHALGLLHEHQSPAHGGQAVKNPQAAIDLYRETQGWSAQQTYDQVINVYNISDVSNFSEVDIHSIMHYPQPKELTGLTEDIPYNQKLSKYDKAYMMLQYPRRKIHPMAEKEGWSYAEALRIIQAPPEVTRKVLGFIGTDRDELTDQISPINIRQEIEGWCRSAHKGTSKLQSVNIGANATFENLKKMGPATAVIRDGQDLCSNNQTKKLKSSNLRSPAHAVTVQDLLYMLPADGVAKTLEILYILRAVNADSTNAEVSVTEHQKDLIRAATEHWETVAGVKFVPATTGQLPNLVIQFNNTDDVQPEKEPRSSCVDVSGHSKAAREDDTTRRDWTVLEADIELHGIFMEADAAAKYKSLIFKNDTGPLNGIILNMRSVLHELGHWLGLHHEFCGLYGYWLHSGFGMPDNDGAEFGASFASTFFATRYDAGSIMDSIGLGLQEAAMQVLQLKGLQPASVIRLQDKTTGDVMSHVDISTTLSIYDKANIALLYPSTTNLVDGTSSTFQLKVLESDPSRTILHKYLTDLSLYTDDNLEAVAAPLRGGKWLSARKAYLDIVANKQNKEAGTLKYYHQFLADKFDVTSTAMNGIFDVQLKNTLQNGVGDRSHGISNPAITKPQHAPGITPDGLQSGSGTSASTEPFIKQLYDKLATLFCPGGGQYFALQFPTRYLDKQSYSYKLDGYLSRFEKPVAVNEAEFVMTDALYDVAPIVGGPNGQTLSRNYSKALNSLIPMFEGIEVRKQRELMRQWLLMETQGGNAAYTVDTRLAIPGIDDRMAREMSASSGLTILPGTSSNGELLDPDTARERAEKAIAGIKSTGKTNPRGMTRMEFSDSLMQAYLKDRTAWETRRDEMIKKASEDATKDPHAMDKLTRHLAHITAVEEAKLASKYADAVVRGYSHTVRGFMGHLDIKTIAETLQDAKDSLRESALSSLYTSSSVYPVAMQPADWFESLETGFTREELSQEPDIIKAAVEAKAQLIDNLENQIANLRAFNKGDITAAKRAMEAAAAKRENAMATLSQKYSASTISAVMLALELASPAGPAISAAKLAADITGLPEADPKRKSVVDKLGGDSNALTEIAGQMDEVSKANDAVNSASRQLTEYMSEYASAVAGDTQTMIDGIQRKLTAAKRDLAELQESYIIARRSRAKQPVNDPDMNDVGKLPVGNGGSRWSEVFIKSSVNNDYTSSSSTSSSSVSSFKVNFWLGSHSDNSSTSEARVSTESKATSLNVDVAMRVAYVTVDRSGWFDPSFFEMSKSFMQGAKAESYTRWSEWKNGQTADAASRAVRDNDTDKPKGYLAAFPVGYVLVKDCVIKVSASSADSSSFKSTFNQQAEKSGGFLCFSHSSASRSSSDSSASSTTAVQGGVVVRVPGPQILGYIMQLTHKDETQPFKETPAEEMFIESPDKLKSFISSKPAHGIGSMRTNFGNTEAGLGVRKYNEGDNDAKQALDNVGATVPMRGIQAPVADGSGKIGPGNLANAIQTALGDSGVAEWLRSQPEGTKEKLWEQVKNVFDQMKA